MRTSCIIYEHFILMRSFEMLLWNESIIHFLHVGRFTSSLSRISIKREIVTNKFNRILAYWPIRF